MNAKRNWLLAMVCTLCVLCGLSSKGQSTKAFMVNLDNTIATNGTNLFRQNSNLLNQSINTNALTASLLAQGQALTNFSDGQSNDLYNLITNDFATLTLALTAQSNGLFNLMTNDFAGLSSNNIFTGSNVFGNMMVLGTWYTSNTYNGAYSKDSTNAHVTFFDENGALFETFSNASAIWSNTTGAFAGNFVDISNGVLTISSNEFVRKTNFISYLYATNSIRSDGGSLFSDGSGDLTLVNNGSSGQLIFKVGATTTSLSAVPGVGGIGMNPYQMDNSITVAPGSLIFSAVGGSGLVGGHWITYPNDSSFQEPFDIVPNNLNAPSWDNQAVFWSQSNRYAMTIDASGGINPRVVWTPMTNISGLSTFIADPGDRLIQCNPTAASCVVTLPNMGAAFQAQVVNWTNESGWTHRASAGVIGVNLQASVPQYQTIQYEIVNLGSNTANTLQVQTSDGAWFTNQPGPPTQLLTIPNLTKVKFTTPDGKNISCEFVQTTPLSIGGQSPWVGNINGAGNTLYGAGTLDATNGNFGALVASNGFASYRSNTVSPTAISFPATTVGWTNPFTFNLWVMVNNSGVTGTAFLVNGTTVSTVLSGPIGIPLQPGEYFSETYTVGSPTATYKPL